MSKAVVLTSSKIEIAEFGVVVGPTPWRPQEHSLDLDERMAVDAGDAPSYQAVWIDLPILVAIGPVPIAVDVVIFVGKPSRYPIIGESPEFIDVPVLKLLGPFAREKRLNRRAPGQTADAASPETVDCVTKRHESWLASIPAVLDGADLFCCGLPGEGRQRGA